MKKVLVLISTCGGRMATAVDEAIAIYREEPVEIHLLNVQVSVSSHVAMFFKNSELAEIHREAGMEALAPARAALDAAAIPYRTHIVVGRTAPTIARFAQEIGCDRIVMGRAEGYAEKVFGTLAAQVRELVGVSGNCTVIGS
ncbi:MAG: putative universal stress protein [Herminiimonas sp.]|nr:putative universal stress protein [Herminiimonas sp.]